MLPWLTAVVLGAAAALALTAAIYGLRGRPLDDRFLAVLAVLELALFAQMFVGIVQGVSSDKSYEKAVFLAYLVTVPFVAPVACFLALKEKTRWAMGVVAGSAFVVVVLVARLVALWGARA